MFGLQAAILLNFQTMVTCRLDGAALINEYVLKRLKGFIGFVSLRKVQQTHNVSCFNGLY